MCGPRVAHRAEHFQRKAQPVLQRSAIVVRAQIGQRRYERREQVAVRGVQFQHVEAGPRAVLRGRHESVAHRVHVVARHGSRHLVVRAPRNRRRRDHLPVSLDAAARRFPPSRAGRTLRAGMAQLQTDFCTRPLVHEIDDARPGRQLLRRPQTGAAWRDAALRRDAHHLGEHQPGTAQCARAQMHHVEIVGHAVLRAVGRHRRDHDAVRQRHVAQLERQEHRRDRTARAMPCAGGEPALHTLQPGPVAQTQILVADALAARQQGIGELLRLQCA